jgi:hypothetical protein
MYNPRLPTTARALPTELFHEILEESILLPEFLDPYCIPEVNNPLLFIGQSSLQVYENEPVYWEAERHRNVLRRVCKSFDSYLRRFDHRYIRIVDLYHGYVPLQAVYTAIRIHFLYTCPVFDFCRQCHLINGNSTTPIDLAHLLSVVGKADSHLAAKIITGRSLAVAKVLENTYEKLPHLRVLLDVDSHAFGQLGSGLGNINQLQTLHLFTDYGHVPWSSLPKSLTTLIYHSEWTHFPYWTISTQLPNLRQLRLQGPADKLGIADLTRILEIFGHQLRSLQIGNPSFGIARTATPLKIWDLCPQLERLDTAIHLDSLPPPSHPLHTLSVSIPLPSDRRHIAGTRYTTAFLTSFLYSRSVSLKRLILQQKWSSMPTTDSLGADYSGQRSWLRDCAIICKEQGVLLEDCDGVEVASPLALPHTDRIL